MVNASSGSRPRSFLLMIRLVKFLLNASPKQGFACRSTRAPSLYSGNLSSHEAFLGSRMPPRYISNIPNGQYFFFLNGNHIRRGANRFQDDGRSGNRRHISSKSTVCGSSVSVLVRGSVVVIMVPPLSCKSFRPRPDMLSPRYHREKQCQLFSRS